MKCVFCDREIEDDKEIVMVKGKSHAHSKCAMKREQAEAKYWNERRKRG